MQRRLILIHNYYSVLNIYVRLVYLIVIQISDYIITRWFKYDRD